ncbi:MAG: MFS transporter permease [Desulfosalsimonadaceae bacterium]
MSEKSCKDKEQSIREVVIPREDAVFWLDSRGWWRNRGGRFRKKKINDYFHAAIAKDEHGYFVSQQKDDVLEKVYFPYEDTALFVFHVIFRKDSPPLLELNTGRRIELDPETLYSKNDCLYIEKNRETIKLSERALMQIAPLLDQDQNGLCIVIRGEKHPVTEY